MALIAESDIAESDALADLDDDNKVETQFKLLGSALFSSISPKAYTRGWEYLYGKFDRSDRDDKTKESLYRHYTAGEIGCK
jgi:hypothetical protein